MPIEIRDFGGTIPKLNPEALPDNVGQLAHNCDLTGGVIAPIGMSGPFVSAHEDDGTLKSEILEEDLFTVAKPAAPSTNTIAYIADPSQWLQVGLADWSTLDDGDVHSTTLGRFVVLPLLKQIYTETGMELTYGIYAHLYIFSKGGPYFFKGPRYQFAFTADPGGLNGGPDVSVNYPHQITAFDNEFPLQRVPLIDTNNNVYANFQVIDVAGPKYDQDLLVTNSNGLSLLVPDSGGGSVTFTIDMNYAQPRRKQLFYTQTLVRYDDAEGPPSEISSQITLRPGQKLKLNTPRGGVTDENNLYRSPTGGEDFLLLDDPNADTYIDVKSNLQAVEIPPFGNFPGGDADAFRAGSVIHPANFAAAFRGNTLYLSDFFRFWAWPDEFTVPFKESIKAIALSGATIIVFSGTRVYGVSGNNPEVMNKFLISDETPLLNPLSLCKIGPTVFFASNDGMIGITGNQYQIVTNKHFTRKQWKTMFPENMVATTADNSIFLETSDAARIPSDTPGVITSWSACTSSLPSGLDPVAQNTNLRLDLEEELKSVTSYDTTSSTSWRWVSKRFWTPQKTFIDYIQVSSDEDVTVGFYADRTLAFTKTFNSKTPVSVIDDTMPSAHEWEISIESTGVVRSVTLFDRNIVTIGDNVTLNTENTPTFKNVRLKFPDRGKFVGGWVSAQGPGATPINFYGDNQAVVTANVQNGEFFTLPRTMGEATHWRVEVATEIHVDELFLTKRVVEPVNDAIRELNGTAYSPWLTKKYELPGAGRLKSIFVQANSSVSINLYYDGSITASQTLAITPGKEIRLADAVPYSSVEFDFNGQDHRVSEVIAILDSPQDIGNEGISVSNLPNWRGHTFKFADSGTFACGSIGASSYTDLKLHLYADSVLVHTETVTDGTVFALPKTLVDGTHWEIDIETEADVTSLILLPRRPEPVEGKDIHITNPKTIAPWLFSRFEFANHMRPMSVRVESTQSVTMRLWADGATDPIKISLTSGVEKRIYSDVIRAGAWEFDFDGDDKKVSEVGIFGEHTELVAGPVQFGTRLNWRGLRHRFPHKGRFKAAVVGVPDNKNVEISIYVDGVLWDTQTRTTSGAFRFPRFIPEGSLVETDIQEVAP